MSMGQCCDECTHPMNYFCAHCGSGGRPTAIQTSEIRRPKDILGGVSKGMGMETQTMATKRYAWAGQIIENPSQEWLDRWVELVFNGTVQDGDLVEI